DLQGAQSGSSGRQGAGEFEGYVFSGDLDLVQGVVDACCARFDVTVEKVQVAREDVTFKLPRALTA
ncbi:MAG: hypothetical protein AAFS03_04580, partial [Pseudomonadota bacterium]